MSAPPVITDAEKRLLSALVSQQPGGAIEWSTLEQATNLTGTVFGDSVAHLVYHGFIECMPERTGCLGAILRMEPRYFMAITSRGVAYFREYGHTSEAEDARDRQLQETPEDQRNAIEDVVRIVMDSFEPTPIYSVSKHRAGIARLDADVLQELEAIAKDEQTMWNYPCFCQIYPIVPDFPYDLCVSMQR